MPIDYNKFKLAVDEGREERRVDGKAQWDDLTTQEKMQVLDAEDRMDEVIEQKRQEEDEFRRKLKEKPADLSWVQGRHFSCYEDFIVGRVESTVKLQGTEAFKAGNYDDALEYWDSAVQMLLSLASPTPGSRALVCTLRNNLAMVYIKLGDWEKVKELTTQILAVQEDNEKALYRRARAWESMSQWDKAEQDLIACVKKNPENKEAREFLAQIQKQLNKDRRTLGGRTIGDIAAGMEHGELCPDGTVRKLRIIEEGPDADGHWLRPPHLDGSSAERVVVTCQMVIRSVGGEELYNSREYRPHPETRKAREELKEYIEMVNFLDQEAGKKPRLLGDFYQKVKKRPVRWYVGDPGIYRGFDLAVRSMLRGEKAMFEIDQPMLEPSVRAYWEDLKMHAGIAGLPSLVYHIEEERLSILEDEMMPEDLEIETKTQRSVRVELELLGCLHYRDRSPTKDAGILHCVAHPGVPEGRVLERGMEVRGSFYVTRPFDGSLLVSTAYVTWRLGVDEGLYERTGDQKEPLRPGGESFVPSCVGRAILDVDWVQLREGACVEVRVREGPELAEIAPQHSAQFAQAQREKNRKNKKSAPCSILVQIFPPDYPSLEDLPAPEPPQDVAPSAQFLGLARERMEAQTEAPE